MEYEYKTLEMPRDYEGKVVATLIAASREGVCRREAVLYIHGYVDYFFQDHLAEAAVADGFGFYALELRKYGRSYLPGQHFNYCRSIREYDADITSAIVEIMRDGCDRIVLMGHSTGGLIASLYASEGKLRERISALVLNSPFFEFNTSALKKKILIPVVSQISRLFPYASKKSELSPFYGESVHASMKGEWNYDLRLKPVDGVPLYFAWLSAVRRAQDRLKKGLHLSIPVLVLSSDRSLHPKIWEEDIFHSDIVLNVDDIERYAARLGKNVLYKQIRGGMHDLFLSPSPVREQALRTVFQWLDGISGRPSGCSLPSRG